MFLARYLIMPILCLGLLAGCALPSQEQRSQSQALDPDAAAATRWAAPSRPSPPATPACPASTRWPTPTTPSPRA